MFSAYNYPTVSDELLEAQLKQSLRPVQPNKDFVNHLQTRLTTPNPMTIERRQTTGLSLLLVSFSLLSGALIILLMRQIRRQAT